MWLSREGRGCCRCGVGAEGSRRADQLAEERLITLGPRGGPSIRALLLLLSDELAATFPGLPVRHPLAPLRFGEGSAVPLLRLLLGGTRPHLGSRLHRWRRASSADAALRCPLRARFARFQRSSASGSAGLLHGMMRRVAHAPDTGIRWARARIEGFLGSQIGWHAKGEALRGVVAFGRSGLASPCPNFRQKIDRLGLP